MMATGQFCLKWNNFHSSIVTAFESLQSTEELVDVTLMCEGRNVKAHKVILSACSPYFRNLFKETPCKHPIIILKDVLYCDLVAILQFMYQGEVLVDQDGLASFLKTAELLQVSGLAGSTSSAIPEDSVPIKLAPLPPPPPALVSKPDIVRTKSPSSPKPAALVKVRNDIVVPVVEPVVIEKENILTTSRDCGDDDEPMQSCSYQTPDNVIIKTEDEQDYADELEYLEPIDDPGSTTTEEQSILERSLKAQGYKYKCSNVNKKQRRRKKGTGKKYGIQQQIQQQQQQTHALPFKKIGDNTFNGKRTYACELPTNCPFCFKYMTRARNLKSHLRYCKSYEQK